MSNLTTVTLTSGAGTGGTGTVSTLDNVIGTAGTPSAQVQTVQGVTSMTPLKVDGSGVTQPVSLTSTTITGTAAVTQSGTWTVQPGNTPNTTAWKVDGSAVTQPVSLATNTPAVQINAGAADAGSGTGGSHTQRFIMDSSQLSTLATTAQTMSAGFQLIDAPTDGTIAKKLAPSATASGATDSRVNAAGSTNATNLKASAGQIYEIDVFNVAAYTVFLKLYNKASAPTVGTDTPVMTIPVPAGGGYSKEFRFGKTFVTGIAYAITKLQADSDTTAVVAGDLTGAISWI